MILSNEILVALIGLISALSVILIRDIALRAINERTSSRRALLRMQLEQAYSPLEYLSYRLLQDTCPDTVDRVAKEIGHILQKHGHLLSEKSLSAFYVLMDDRNNGAQLLQESFVSECAAEQMNFRNGLGIEKFFFFARP